MMKKFKWCHGIWLGFPASEQNQKSWCKKSENWDDREMLDDRDQAEHIPDPDANKPNDWDNDMDNEWEPPMIDNPA